MKYIKQFGIIMIVTCMGELLKYLLSFPIPSSIYGLCLMLLLLLVGIIKIESVKETAFFLIEIMPLMFVPAAVGLIESWDQLGHILLPVITITVISTFLVMIISGKLTDLFLEMRRKQK